MATRNPTVSTAAGAQFCDYCHQKPKFSNHSYCSKTCATQAAALCNHCHKKPKFQNFDYCGKNCASLANPSGAKLGGGVRTGQVGAAQPRPTGGQRGQQQQQQQQPAFDPVQIAKLVVQQIPQVQALLGGTAGVATQQQPQQAYHHHQQQQSHPPNNYAQQPAPPSHRSANSNPVNNPFMNTTNPNMGGAVHPGLGLAHASFPQHQYQQQALNADDVECLIPGCGKPVHVDAKGLKTSDYCSQRHREEAVASGLASPCIMCLTKPQSHTDYFCGRTCREESLSKRYDAAEETRIEGDEDEEVDASGLNGNNNVQSIN